MQSQAPELSPAVRRGRVMKHGVKRSRKGCATCKRRKKKCDESPGESCANCSKGNIKCSGYPQQAEWSPENLLRKSSARRDQTTMAQNNYVPSRMVPIDPSQNDYGFDYSGGANPVSSQHAQQGFGRELITNDFNTHDNIDLQVDPIYQNDFYYDQAILSYQEMQLRSPLYNIPLLHLINGVDTPLQEQLFDQYRSSTSRYLTVSNGHDNPFNSIILPLAVRDKTLMRLLLSLAGLQMLKRRPPGSDPDLQRETVRLHQESQQEQYQRVRILKSQFLESSSGVDHDGTLILPRNVAYTDQDLEVIFTTYLVLCLYEVFEGTGNGTGNAHLESAGEIMDLATKHSRMGEGSLSGSIAERMPMHRFLLDFYEYHAALASVTLPFASIIRPRYDQNTNAFGPDTPLVGAQDGLIKFVRRISKLRDIAHERDGKLDFLMVDTSLAIFADLKAWQPQVTCSQPEALVAGFYQMALYIWLFSIMYPEQSEHNKVQENVRRILEGMREIQTNDGVMACLLFPLFVAGSAAFRQKDRDQVVEHFTTLKEWSAFGNIDLGLTTVKGMWKRHDAGERNSWNWVKQLNSTQISILVT